jgi:hypothetical protein
MPMDQSTNSYYDQVNDRLIINTDFSDIKSDYADLRLLIHDINSAANTFHLLVEEIATDLKPELTTTQYKKIQQLRNHVTLNKIILRKISESIREFLLKRRSK